MPQREIVLILARQLASDLAIPLLLVDAEGETIFFNEAAERLLGLRFDEIEEMSIEDRARLFAFRDEELVQPLHPTLTEPSGLRRRRSAPAAFVASAGRGDWRCSGLRRHSRT